MDKNPTPPAVLYEVYSKRALHEPIADLVLLDRDTWKINAVKSAIKWGACVVRVECEILTQYPLTRRVISSEVIWVHKPNRRRLAFDDLTVRIVKGKLRQNNRSLYKKATR